MTPAARVSSIICWRSQLRSESSRSNTILAWSCFAASSTRASRQGGSALLLSTGPPGVVDHRLDPEHVAHPDDRVGDLAPPWVTLALHMETALARTDPASLIDLLEAMLRPLIDQNDVQPGAR